MAREWKVETYPDTGFAPVLGDGRDSITVYNGEMEVQLEADCCNGHGMHTAACYVPMDKLVAFLEASGYEVKKRAGARGGT